MTDVVIASGFPDSLVIAGSSGVETSIVLASVVAGPQGAPGGSTETKVAAQALGGQRVVILTSSNQVDYADNSVLNHAHAVFGITTGAASSGANATLQRSGDMADGAFSFSPGLVYLGLNGLLTQVYPSAAEFVLIVGYAVSATRFVISIQNPIII